MFRLQDRRVSTPRGVRANVQKDSTDARRFLSLQMSILSENETDSELRRNNFGKKYTGQMVKFKLRTAML